MKIFSKAILGVVGLSFAVPSLALGGETVGMRFPWERAPDASWLAQGESRPFAVPRKRPARDFYRKVSGKGPVIAFTFDDGPRPWTAQVLDALKQRGLKATFFVTGESAQYHPAIIKRMIAEGHEVANHTLTHKDNYLHRAPHQKVDREVRGGHEVIRRLAGVAPRVFRPPGGNFTTDQNRWIHETFGYANINWSVDPGDGRTVKPSPETFTRRILSQVHDGAIILSHDLWKSTVAAIPATLDALLARGYQFLTVSDLIALDDPYEAVRWTEEELREVDY
jgi:peptidoglycan/xylan/chitin deacetylase (PgdA/CDA1 family)